MMKIPHSRPTITQDDMEAVRDVLASGMISQGSKVKEFEKAFARFIGKKHAVACSSGTSALHLALLCLDINPGNEVIMPSYVCSSPYLACLHAGAIPRIADIGTTGFNICQKNIDTQKSDRSKAVIIPHMFGTPADLDEISAEGISVIEDCAQSLGAKYHDKMVGTYGEVSVFSFYATKMLTTGEGGMLLTNNQDICEHAKELRAYDMKTLSPPKYNYKMTDFQAALGISQLRKLSDFIRLRKKKASLYSEALGDCDIGFPETHSHVDPAFYRYVISVRNLKKIYDFTKKEGVACERPVFQPLHTSLGLSLFPNAERAYNQALSIPLYPSLSIEEQEYVIRTLRRVLPRI